MNKLFIKLLNLLFGERPHENPRLPQAGERWVFATEDKSPWPPKKYTPVTILGVKDGWVRFYMGKYFPDERMEVKFFITIYKPYGGNSDAESNH